MNIGESGGAGPGLEGQPSDWSRQLLRLWRNERSENKRRRNKRSENKRRNFCEVNFSPSVMGEITSALRAVGMRLQGPRETAGL